MHGSLTVKHLLRFKKLANTYGFLSLSAKYRACASWTNVQKWNHKWVKLEN